MDQEVNHGFSTRRKVGQAYLLIFYALGIWKWLDGGWLYQYDPFVFQTRMDGTSWLFMRSGFHQWLISHPGIYIWADLFFTPCRSCGIWWTVVGQGGRGYLGG